MPARWPGEYAGNLPSDRLSLTEDPDNTSRNA